MDETTIKIHDVMHDETDFVASELEEELLRLCLSESVTNIRIAKGYKNSPIYITIDANSVTMNRAKQIARNILYDFQRKVPGVDVDKCVRDKNIRIV